MRGLPVFLSCSQICITKLAGRVKSNVLECQQGEAYIESHFIVDSIKNKIKRNWQNTETRMLFQSAILL